MLSTTFLALPLFNPDDIRLLSMSGTLSQMTSEGRKPPVNHEADSVGQLRLLSAGLNGGCHHVVVKNR